MIPGIVAGYPVTPTPPPSGWNAAVAALSPWGWWKLDETAGNDVTAIDASGNERHGAYTAAGTQAAGLFAGSTASQSSLGGRVNLPNFPLPSVPVFSIGAFIKANSTASEQSILSADGGGGGRRWQFTKTPAHLLKFTTIQPSVTTTTGATSINDAGPHLVILVFDQTLAAAAGRVKIYLDGSLEVASTGAITISPDATTAPAIGARNNSANQELWGGGIDECFIVGGALSSTDVAALWAARNT